MNESNVASIKPLNHFLRMAIVAGVESAVRIHIERGDNLNARDTSGMTPLMLCAARNKPVICALLLSAGADHRLLDPSGRTALQIAIEAGSKPTAEILGAASTSIAASPPSNIALNQELAELKWDCTAPSTVVDSVIPAQHDVSTSPFESKVPGAQPDQASSQSSTSIEDLMDDGEFDLSGWEAENEPARPDSDVLVVESASAVQTAISDHKPIDSSAEWDDVDAYLPDVALPLARADDIEGRARLRLLLLRAIREGSVPALDVQAQSTNDDHTVNPEAEAYLTMVINDLGAETDERFEYAATDENFEVFIDPEETAAEEAALDDALFAIDSAASPLHEPLRIYQREFQRMRLLSAEEEVQLAKDMEAALDAALDALATWPDGIARTLAAGEDAVVGLRQLSSIWLGNEPDSAPVSGASSDVEVVTQPESEEAADQDEEFANEKPADTGSVTFADLLRKLAALVGGADGAMASSQKLRQILSDLRLNRRFLLELINAASGPNGCPEFQIAMASFRKARDQMVAANLKLSFFHAKKYLRSGEPLDDLAQEGNIGLLKAVDRYDWRRGFRFSTYATWWIRQQISRYVADKVRIIRVPVHIHEKLQRTESIAKDFETATGREPTLEELAERVEIPSQKLAVLLRIAAEPVYIDEETIDDMIAIDTRDDYVSPDPADLVEQSQLNLAVDRLISSLSTKDRKEERVLRMRFGVGVHEALTLDEIGMRFGVTRERIRQIESKAIRKLRHPGISKPFARTVLGVQTEQNPLSPNAQEPEDEELCVDMQASAALEAQKQPAAVRSLSESNQTVGPSKSTALDRMLVQAIELGVRVEDGRATDSGRVWVRLLSPPDNRHRRLARKLIELGFEYSPGKGYWR